MFFKKTPHRVFYYPTRFYKPEDDKNEKRKRKLGFRRQATSKRKRRSPIIWLLFIIVAIYIYLKLTGQL